MWLPWLRTAQHGSAQIQCNAVLASQPKDHTRGLAITKEFVCLALTTNTTFSPLQDMGAQCLEGAAILRGRAMFRGRLMFRCRSKGAATAPFDRHLDALIFRGVT